MARKKKAAKPAELAGAAMSQAIEEGTPGGEQGSRSSPLHADEVATGAEQPKQATAPADGVSSETAQTAASNGPTTATDPRPAISV